MGEIQLYRVSFSERRQFILLRLRRYFGKIPCLVVSEVESKLNNQNPREASSRSGIFRFSLVNVSVGLSVTSWPNEKRYRSEIRYTHSHKLYQKNAFFLFFRKNDPEGRQPRKTSVSRGFSPYLLYCLVKIHVRRAAAEDILKFTCICVCNCVCVSRLRFQIRSMGVYVPNFKSVSLLVWPGDVTQTHK